MRASHARRRICSIRVLVSRPGYEKGNGGEEEEIGEII